MAHEARRRGHLPPADAPHRLLLIRTVAILALLATAMYLGWRALATLNLDAWWLAVPMLASVVEQVMVGPAPMVTLYVNDFNTAARATYAHIGFREVGDFSTVLL